MASRDGTHAHCSMNIKYSVYSRAATIIPDGRYVRRLFEGGYYSKCSVYSRKYGIYQRNAPANSSKWGSLRLAPINGFTVLPFQY